MTSTVIIQNPAVAIERLVRSGLTDHHAKAIIDTINEDAVVRGVPDKDDFTALSAAIVELKAELKSDFRIGLAEQQSDILKWTFAFWVTNVFATVGFILAVLPYMV